MDVNDIKKARKLRIPVSAVPFELQEALSPAEAIGKLSLKINEIIERLFTKQDKEDNNLETTAKTVVGAINELNNRGSGVSSVNGKTGAVVLKAEDIEDNEGSTIEEDLTALANDVESLDTNKQDKTDNTLETTAKSIVGAINEVNSKSAKVDDETIELDADNKLKVKHDDTLIVGDNGLSVATDGETIQHNADEKLEVILSEDGALEKADDGLAVKIDGVSITKNVNGELQAEASGGGDLYLHSFQVQNVRTDTPHFTQFTMQIIDKNSTNITANSFRSYISSLDSNFWIMINGKIAESDTDLSVMYPIIRMKKQTSGLLYLEYIKENSILTKQLNIDAELTYSTTTIGNSYTKKIE